MRQKSSNALEMEGTAHFDHDSISFRLSGSLSATARRVLLHPTRSLQRLTLTA